MAYEIFNTFDLPIIFSINELARESGLFDRAVYTLANNHLLKGGVVMTMLWWLWFRPARSLVDRPKILLILVSSVVAIAVARFLAWVLPMRLRPMHNPDIGFVLPNSIPPVYLDGWSAFPSDHAVLFFVFATGFFLIHRVAGIIAFAYVTIFICLPRIYLGLHHPTDLIAGALIGIGIAVVFLKFVNASTIFNTALIWESKRPQLFYPALFLLTFQVAELFDSSRAWAKVMAVFVKSVMKLFA